MTSDDHIVTEKQGKIGFIRLNRPEKLNAISNDMFARLTASVEEMEADDDVRAIVLCGTGRSFCAGRDLRDIQEFHGSGAEAARPQIGSVTEIFNQLEESGTLTVAVVQGYAMGMGCVLALAADLTVAEENAVFAMAEARLGVGTFVAQIGLRHAMTRKILLEMLLTGDDFSASRAHQLGLVNRLAEPGRGMDVALSWLNEFIDKDAGYIRETKTAARLSENMPHRDALAYLHDKGTMHHGTGSGRAGIEQFLS